MSWVQSRARAVGFSGPEWLWLEAPLSWACFPEEVLWEDPGAGACELRRLSSGTAVMST